MQAGALGEIGRVRDHLRGAEALLDARSLAGLDPAQRLTRQLLRAELARYREEGLFPKNRDFPRGRRPYFIDAEGTRCAMAHLMELGGAGALVAEIAAASNNAYVEELANDPRVVAWLRAAGLTVEEAARIQPSYDCVSRSPAQCVCALSMGSEPRPSSLASPLFVWEGTIVGTSAAAIERVARIDAVLSGDAAHLVGTERDVLVFAAIEPSQRVLGYGLVESDVAAPDIAVLSIDEAGAIGPTCLLRAECAPPPNPDLSKTQLLDLLGLKSSECTSALAALDPRWGRGRRHRDPDDVVRPGPTFPPPLIPPTDASAAAPEEGSSSDGCNAAGASLHESLTVLAAVIAALAVRRWALRPRAAR